MPLATSIFLDFNLPNTTTWFYFSLLLALALFFKFSRLLSVRNLDVVTLFLLAPGLLLVQENQWGWHGYLWLLCGSVYFLLRCLFDLALVRRPALSPNLNLGGLAWLGCALGVFLISVALRPQQPQSPAEPAPVGKDPAPVRVVQSQVEHQVTQQVPAGTDTGFWVSRSLALLCHLAVVLGMIFIGRRHFQDLHAGMAAATFYLLLPYTAMHIYQWHHVWPSALLVWAVAAYRRPVAAGLLLGLAAGSAYFPALLIPLWLSFYWRRGVGRFAAAVFLAAGVSLAVTALSLWLQGDLDKTLRDAFVLSDWQPWKKPKPETKPEKNQEAKPETKPEVKPETKSFWANVHWAYRIPVFVAYLAFLVATAFWPSPKNLGNVLALSAALLIGIQFWYADQGGVYVLWYLPFFLLMVFRPNLSDSFPPLIASDSDRLSRLGKTLGRWAVRVLGIPEPAARV